MRKTRCNMKGQYVGTCTCEFKTPQETYVWLLGPSYKVVVREVLCGEP